MKPLLPWLIAATCSFWAFSCAPGPQKEASLPQPDPRNGGISLPEGFGAVVFADTLGAGRHLAVAPNGDVYAHLMNDRKGYALVALRDTNGDGRADLRQGFGTEAGTGIEIRGNYLYFSNQTRVMRYAMAPGQLLPQTDKTDTIARLVPGDGHMEKPFAFDNQGNMYVNVGSYSNCCEQTLRTAQSPGDDPCRELETRAGIWKFSAEALNQDQTPEKRYASGIRNAVAISWNPFTQKLYAVQHGRDDLHRFWEAKFTPEQNVEWPAEEFFEVNEGDFMGWPYCFYNPEKKVKVLNPEYGGDGQSVERCADAKLPLVGFPGHWGPNDLLFYQGSMFPERYKEGAFIAFHGSWNRLGQNQAGFLVAFVPMKNGKVTGEYEIFADGFVGAQPVTSPGDALYRPCGLAEGPDGSLYILDSMEGRLWRVFHYPAGTSAPGEAKQAMNH